MTAVMSFEYYSTHSIKSAICNSAETVRATDSRPEGRLESHHIIRRNIPMHNAEGAVNMDSNSNELIMVMSQPLQLREERRASYLQSDSVKQPRWSIRSNCLNYLRSSELLQLSHSTLWERSRFCASQKSLT